MGGQGGEPKVLPQVCVREEKRSFCSLNQEGVRRECVCLRVANP